MLPSRLSHGAQTTLCGQLASSRAVQQPSKCLSAQNSCQAQPPPSSLSSLPPLPPLPQSLLTQVESCPGNYPPTLRATGLEERDTQLGHPFHSIMELPWLLLASQFAAQEQMPQAWEARMVADRKLPLSSQATKARVSPKMLLRLQSSADGSFTWPHTEDMPCLGQLRCLSCLWSRGGTPTAQWLPVEREGEGRWVDVGGV